MIFSYSFFFFPSHPNPPARVRNDRSLHCVKGASGWVRGGPPTGFRRGAGGGGVGRPLHLRHAQGSPGGSLRALAWRQWMRARPSAAPRQRLPLIVPSGFGAGACSGEVLDEVHGFGRPPASYLQPKHCETAARAGLEFRVGLGAFSCARLGWVWRRVHWRLWGGVHRCGGWGSPR